MGVKKGLSTSLEGTWTLWASLDSDCCSFNKALHAVGMCSRKGALKPSWVALACGKRASRKTASDTSCRGIHVSSASNNIITCCSEIHEASPSKHTTSSNGIHVSLRQDDIDHLLQVHSSCKMESSSSMVLLPDSRYPSFRLHWLPERTNYYLNLAASSFELAGVVSEVHFRSSSSKIASRRSRQAHPMGLRQAQRPTTA